MTGSFLRFTDFLADIPDFFGILHVQYSDRVGLDLTLGYGATAIINFAAAWLLSRWAYGVGPLAALSRYRTISRRRNYV